MEKWGCFDVGSSCGDGLFYSAPGTGFLPLSSRLPSLNLACSSEHGGGSVMPSMVPSPDYGPPGLSTAPNLVPTQDKPQRLTLPTIHTQNPAPAPSHKWWEDHAYSSHGQSGGPLRLTGGWTGESSHRINVGDNYSKRY